MSVKWCWSPQCPSWIILPTFYCHPRSSFVRCASSRLNGRPYRWRQLCGHSVGFRLSRLCRCSRVLAWTCLAAADLTHDISTEHVRDHVNVRWHNFALIPIYGESVQHLGDLAVVFVLVDSSEICEHQIGDRECFRPCASDLDACKVNLLTCRQAIGRVSRV